VIPIDQTVNWLKLEHSRWDRVKWIVVFHCSSNSFGTVAQSRMQSLSVIYLIRKRGEIGWCFERWASKDRINQVISNVGFESPCSTKGVYIESIGGGG